MGYGSWLCEKKIMELFKMCAFHLIPIFIDGSAPLRSLTVSTYVLIIVAMYDNTKSSSHMACALII